MDRKLEEARTNCREAYLRLNRSASTSSMHKVQGKEISTKEECLLRYLELATTLSEVEMAGQGLFPSKSEGGSRVSGSYPPDVSARPLKQDHSREIFDEVRRNLEDELQREHIWNMNDLGKLLKLYIVMLFCGQLSLGQRK